MPEVPPEDQKRLDELATLRKEEGLWDYQRRYQVSKRHYLRMDVLKDAGSAVVWWLAKHEDNLEQADIHWSNPGEVSVLSVNRAYPWEVTKTRFGVAAEDHPSGLRCVSGDDQVVCSARGPGPADVGEQAPMMGCCRLRVVKNVNGRGYGYQCPSPFGRPAGRIGRFDPTRYSATDTAAIASSSSSSDERSMVPRS